MPIGIVTSDEKRQAFCSPTYLSRRIFDSLLYIEDRRYFDHFGLDLRALIRATVYNISKMRILQGGSTITQQLARCISQDYRKCFARKCKEAILAMKLKHSFSKNEIIHLYINNVYFGRNIYGIRAASISYFGKEPFQLSTREQIYLITLLRGPNLYLNNSSLFLNRYKVISSKLIEGKVVRKRKISHTSHFIEIKERHLHAFGANCASAIATGIERGNFIVKSDIIKDFQDYLTHYINSCKYAMSIVCVAHGSVIACGSSFGSDYPFTYSANVGSTLKPFIYCYLRECGISPNDKFPTAPMNVDKWPIKEYCEPQSDYLTLAEALAISNNNVFVNACYSIGIETVLDHLSQVLQMDRNELVPATVLGATTKGISLHHLTNAYYKYFRTAECDGIKSECLQLLRNIAEKRFHNSSGMFLKTGTTNSFYERYAIVGHAKALFGFLRHDKAVLNEVGKEGDLLSSVFSFLNGVKSKISKWL